VIVARRLGALLAVLATAAVAHAAGDGARGRDVYGEKCVLCHGSQGAGWDWSRKVESPPVPVPDLVAVAPQRSEQYLFEVIKNGGEAVGRTRFMPAFGFQLSDEEIWHVVAYVRSLTRDTKP
jgi:cytochrome c oxidase cbb3-type subunit III